MRDKANNGAKPGAISFSAAQSLVDEIGRLNAQIARLTRQVGELEQLAHMDSLVRLPNRRGLFRDLKNVIARLNRCGGSAAMIFVDVDGLKQINDRCGHPTGDAVLIRIAEILVASVRASDTVARLSGDEFVVLLTDVDELGAWNMALRLVEATVASPPSINNHYVPLSIAVGVSAISKGDEPEDIISRADNAMYRMKTP